MPVDLLAYTPYTHRLFVRSVFITPGSSFFPGYKGPPADYHPSEVPAFVRKRLIDFLEARFPVPPSYLQDLISPAEVPGARRVYKELRSSGAEAGDAILAMGLMARKAGFNLPESCVSRIVARGCSCIEDEYGPQYEDVVTATAAGEPLDEDYSVIWCHEALGVVEKEGADSQRRRATAADARRLAAFRALRTAS